MMEEERGKLAPCTAVDTYMQVNKFGAHGHPIGTRGSLYTACGQLIKKSNSSDNFLAML